MKTARWASLTNKVVRPDIDKHLIPLLMYRGNTDLSRMSRLWNFAIACMESDVQTYPEAVLLSHNPDFAHLCGPVKPLPHSLLPGLFGRLLDNPNVTRNISGLTEYVRSVNGLKPSLQRVPLYTNSTRNRNFAQWRIVGFSPEHIAAKEGRAAARRAETERRKEEKARARIARAPRENLAYPYMLHRPRNGDGERALLLDVHNAVPKYLPDWLRADICQDLIVAVLAGDVERDELKGSVKDFTRKVLKMHPMKYGDLSLDAPIWDNSSRTIGDTISDEDYRTRLGW